MYPPELCSEGVDRPPQQATSCDIPATLPLSRHREAMVDSRAALPPLILTKKERRASRPHTVPLSQGSVSSGPPIIGVTGPRITLQTDSDGDDDDNSSMANTCLDDCKLS